MDPGMTTTYSGPSAGPGASYGWEGNSEVGKGTMKIIESLPNESVKIDLEFLEPFAAKHLTEFTLRPAASGTKVTGRCRERTILLLRRFALL